jgi:hypothetical protein
VLGTLVTKITKEILKNLLTFALAKEQSKVDYFLMANFMSTLEQNTFFAGN